MVSDFLWRPVCPVAGPIVGILDERLGSNNQKSVGRRDGGS
jgi:hypothetical protein